MTGFGIAIKLIGSAIRQIVVRSRGFLGSCAL